MGLTQEIRCDAQKGAYTCLDCFSKGFVGLCLIDAHRAC